MDNWRRGCGKRGAGKSAPFRAERDAAPGVGIISELPTILSEFDLGESAPSGENISEASLELSLQPFKVSVSTLVRLARYCLYCGSS